MEVVKYLNFLCLLPYKIFKTLDSFAEASPVSNEMAFQSWNRFVGDDDCTYVLEIDRANAARCQIKITNLPNHPDIDD